MKISEVIITTGLSKKAIYHYIEEGLISPKSNPQNNYYNFAAQEIIQLTIIKKLRELGFSLASILSILKYPNTMKYHLYLQLKKEEQELALHQERIKSITSCIDKMSLGVTQKDIADSLLALSPIALEGEDPSIISAEDAQLISIFMWGMFVIDVPMTEYRQYLWNKLVKILQLPENQYLIPVKQYIYSRPVEYMEAQFAKRNQEIDRISRLTENDWDSYVKEMLQNIERNILDTELIKKWKSIYRLYMKPITICADSTAHELLCEFTPRFTDYCKNINYCCLKLYEYLKTKDGEALFCKLTETLSTCIDMEHSHSGELAAFACFQDNV